MSTCKDCLHYDVCQALEEYNDIPKVHPKQCGCFKPKADYVEVKYGKWEEIQGEIGNPFNNQVVDTIDLFVCSVCNEIFDVSETRNFCPKCGAKMKGGAE